MTNPAPERIAPGMVLNRVRMWHQRYADALLDLGGAQLVEDEEALAYLERTLSEPIPGRVKELRDGLEQIARGEGAYSLDPLTHAGNCIDEMKAKAKDLLAILDDYEKARPLIKAAKGMVNFDNPDFVGSMLMSSTKALIRAALDYKAQMEKEGGGT
jgi:hypothetical protein